MLKMVVTDEHLRVIEQLSFHCLFNTWIGDEISPTIDIKRPFGNTGATDDVCRILGYVANKKGEYSKKQYLHALRILAEIPTVLSIICRNRTFSCGEYNLSGTDYICERVDLERAYTRILVREPLRRCMDDPKCAEVIDDLDSCLMPICGNPFAHIEKIRNALPQMENESIKEAWQRVLDIFAPYEKRWEERKMSLEEYAKTL